MEKFKELLEQGSDISQPNKARIQIQIQFSELFPEDNWMPIKGENYGHTCHSVFVAYCNGEISMERALYLSKILMRSNRENRIYENQNYLTNGGNLLRNCELGWYFQKPNGEFIREVSSEEAEYLSQNCLEIEVNNPSKHPEFLPTWHFIKSICVLADYTNYKPKTSNNGGYYFFHTYHDWYVAQYPNGEWKFAFVERHFTSAEFSYDELAGSFQSDMEYLCLSNVADRREYNSQKGIEWKDGEKFYTSSEVLEKIASFASFPDLWNEMFEYIPSLWDEDEGGFTKKALSFSDKKDIITRLKELGVTKQDSKPSLRRQRRGGRR